jgi:hypothetical protein
VALWLAHAARSLLLPKRDALEGRTPLQRFSTDACTTDIIAGNNTKQGKLKTVPSTKLTKEPVGAPNQE